jgi:hypothetical protein
MLCGCRYVNVAQKFPKHFAWTRRIVHAHIVSPIRTSAPK